MGDDEIERAEAKREGFVVGWLRAMTEVDQRGGTPGLGTRIDEARKVAAARFPIRKWSHRKVTTSAGLTVCYSESIGGFLVENPEGPPVPVARLSWPSLTPEDIAALAGIIKDPLELVDV